ncbi:MAG: hypothetical protein ACLS5G_04815 [Streptococcus sp.]
MMRAKDGSGFGTIFTSSSQSYSPFATYPSILDSGNQTLFSTTLARKFAV